MNILTPAEANSLLFKDLSPMKNIHSFNEYSNKGADKERFLLGLLFTG